ncbi:MAG: hypothetical protein ACK4UJ_02505 [Leptonema sp. (in: bacteria)]
MQIEKNGFSSPFKKKQYLFYHLLELDLSDNQIQNWEIFFLNNPDKEIVKKTLYSMILNNKTNCYLRILLIKIFLKNQEWERAIKWGQRSLIYANLHQKKILYCYLSKAYFKKNRIERAILYTNLSLKIDHHYKPAKRLKKIYSKSVLYY